MATVGVKGLTWTQKAKYDQISLVVRLFLSRVRLPGTAWATNYVNRC